MRERSCPCQRPGCRASAWRDDGTLPVAQKLPGPNGAYLFRRSDVEALLTEQATA